MVIYIFHKYAGEKVSADMVSAFLQNNECDSRNMTITVVMDRFYHKRVFANFIILASNYLWHKWYEGIGIMIWYRHNDQLLTVYLFTLCSLNSIHYYRLTKNQVANSVDEIHSSKGATRACLLLKLHVITYIIKNKWKNCFNFQL